jgi:hypothetical protein
MELMRTSEANEIKAQQNESETYRRMDEELALCSVEREQSRSPDYRKKSFENLKRSILCDSKSVDNSGNISVELSSENDIVIPTDGLQEDTNIMAGFEEIDENELMDKYSSFEDVHGIESNQGIPYAEIDEDSLNPGFFKYMADQKNLVTKNEAFVSSKLSAIDFDSNAKEIERIHANIHLTTWVHKFLLDDVQRRAKQQNEEELMRLEIKQAKMEETRKATEERLLNSRYGLSSEQLANNTERNAEVPKKTLKRGVQHAPPEHYGL